MIKLKSKHEIYELIDRFINKNLELNTNYLRINLKTFTKILIYVWMAFWLYFGVAMLLETPRQIERDQEFIETQIKPSVNFIKDFKTKNGSLPNNREYYVWQREFHKDYSSDLTQKVDTLIPGLGKISYIRNLQNVNANDYKKFKNADWNTDFAIGVWRGEWTAYYFSWSDSYDTNDSTWFGAFLSLFGMIGIGIFPFLLALRKKKFD